MAVFAGVGCVAAAATVAGVGAIADVVVICYIVWAGCVWVGFDGHRRHHRETVRMTIVADRTATDCVL